LATGALTVADPAGRPILADAGGPFRAEGAGFRLDKRLGPDTHVFGLGDKMGPLDRRGRVFTLWNTDSYRYQESTDPLYKALPFFMTVDAGRAAGVFLDDTWRSAFDFGVERPDVMSFGADGGGIDYYVFAGPDPKAVLAQYAWLTGAPPLPPLWAFGFQQSRFSYGSDAEARAVADRLRRDRIPADVIWFDIGVLDRKRAFTIDREQFPDFTKLVGDLDRQGLKSVVIADLHLAAEPGYAPFDSGVAGDHFVKTADGARYVGPVWPGPSVFPDFSRAQTRRWWGGLFADLYDRAGVAGFWNDMNEPSVFTPAKTMPPEVRHRIEEPGFASRVATHAEMHNVYGMLNSEATYEGLLELKPDQRPFVMTRATYAGGQRYAVTWTGDNSATWNHLRLSTPQLLSLGLSGFAFAGDDLGGFAGSPSPDLLTRWLEVGAFNPIMRDHSDAGTAPQEPWAGGAAAEAVRRRYIEARYRLLPYIYAAAEETSRTGAPVMRPLFMEFPAAAQGRPLDLDAPSEFMLGRALLVAPSPWPESPDAYAVTLPPGEWYDFWTGLKVDAAALAERTGASGTSTAVAGDAANAPHSLQVTPALETLPVYVRAGAIVPSQPLVQSTAQRPQGPLRLDVYPGPDCRGEVYADDGVSRAYLKGASLRQQFTCTVSAKGVAVTLNPATGAFRPWWTRLEVAVHAASPRLRLAAPVGGAGPARYDAASRTLAVEIPAPRGPAATTLAFAEP
ncbi:MAG: glycoside hydrolase family 31 protein, partial [Caulobacteraceae bacterium]|nr:glycoside hydrolase family 31 protein [Caulobacter sp.]